MMDGEEAYEETAGYPRSTRSSKTMRTKPLPRKTIARNLKTKKDRSRPRETQKIGKLTDDGEAAARKTPNRNNAARGLGNKNRTTNRKLQRAEFRSKKPQKRKTTGKRQYT